VARAMAARAITGAETTRVTMVVAAVGVARNRIRRRAAKPRRQILPILKSRTNLPIMMQIRHPKSRPAPQQQPRRPIRMRPQKPHEDARVAPRANLPVRKTVPLWKHRPNRK
jgi:hypothetical protein